MFGISKKTLIGFVLLNIIVFGSIGYLGLLSNTMNHQDDLRHPDDMQYPVAYSFLPDNRQSTKNGDVFWVTTQYFFNDLNHNGKNDDGETIVQHVLHRMTSSYEMMNYILFNSTGVEGSGAAFLEQIIGDQIYISMLLGQHINDFLLEMSISSLPAQANANFTEVEGRIAVIDRGQAPKMIDLKETGKIIVPIGDTNTYTGLRIFDLKDLDFVNFTTPIDGDSYYRNDFVPDFGSTIFYPSTNATEYAFPFLSEFYRYDLDEDNNLILFGKDQQGQGTYLTTNIDQYQSTDNSTANYLRLPTSLTNLTIKQRYDDNNDFYLLFENRTEHIYPTYTSGGVTYSGDRYYTTVYTIVAATGWQSQFTGQVFDNNSGLQYNTFLSSNTTTFVSSRINHGNFYGGFDAFLYQGKIYNTVEMKAEHQQDPYEIPPAKSVFLFSAPVTDLLTNSTSSANYHHIYGDDIAERNTDQPTIVSGLEAMAYRYQDRRMHSIIYFIQGDGLFTIIAFESQEGIL